MGVSESAPATAKGARTRQSVLDAAIVRFGREGFRATSVADIARDASVGATVTYAYFPGKEALFLAALDEDAAAVIREGLADVSGASHVRELRQSLVFTLVEAVQRHPLARRVLSGLEPEVTERVVDIPAMADLRRALAERIRTDQDAGLVRHDIDPVAIANGSVAIIVSLVMTVLQVGPAAAGAYADDVLAVFEAALEPPRRPDRSRGRS
ncbi:MAG: TetR/AcrR family transcriptional regulator [Acidimicrobiales bacterium]|jgi:AcrR family transcriptional regulator|nr:TetR/AcrR family transcriptional regulator [Acidimicrobiales bacterium]